MSTVGDLLYFLPQIGLARTARLMGAKIRKRLAKRRLARTLAEPEPEETLLRRLGFDEDIRRTADRLREAWEPLAPFHFGPDVEAEAGPTAARAVLEGRQRLFGEEVDVGWPPRWDWRR